MREFFSSLMLFKFFKFALVGLSGMIVDFGTTWILKEKFKVPKYVANAAGFILAASSNYFLNRIWTFGSNDPEIAWEYARFFFVSLAGLGINTLILWVLVSKFHKKFYISKLFAVGVVMIWNFLVNLLFTFH